MENESVTTNEIFGQDSVIAPTERIVYRRAPLHRRVLANFIDIFIFVAVLAALFMASRAIVMSTDGYQNGLNRLEQIRLDSGVYYKNKDGSTSDIITYLNSNTAYNTEYKKDESAKAIDKFMTYAKSVCSSDIYREMQNNYDIWFKNKEKMIFQKEQK